MCGLIGKNKAATGQREALITILVQASAELPDCLSYIVAQDAADPDALWVTEAWESAESQHSLRACWSEEYLLTVLAGAQSQ